MKSPQLLLLRSLAVLLAAVASQAGDRLPIPDKLVVLTFDDSVASHYSVARPLLKRYGFGATFFITEGFGFATNKQAYMAWLHQEGYRAIALRDLARYVDPEQTPADPMAIMERRKRTRASE